MAIGTFNEKTMHAQLKSYYEPDLSKHEQPFMGYIADIKNDDGITEIQNGNFSHLRGKLEAFTSKCHVTVVYPIPRNKRIVWLDPETGEASEPHRSPKHGSFYNAFSEFKYITDQLLLPGLSFHLWLVDVEDVRFLNGWSRDRKRGSVRSERRLLELGELRTVEGKYDIAGFIPEELKDTFTVKDFAVSAGISLSLARETVYVLKKTGCISQTGKCGRAFEFKKNEDVRI